MNEQFSAFLDNEATRDESDSVINALLRDERLRESWGRQHWLRETLRAHRGEPAVGLDSGFSTRVMQAIAQEDSESRPVRADVRPISTAPRARRRRWRGMTTGLAVAASAAGMAFLVTGGSITRDENAPENLQEPAVAAATVSPSATRVKTSRDVANTPADSSAMLAAGNVQNADIRSVSTNARRTSPADHWSVSDPALEEELNSYLVEHNGLARGYGLSGTTPAFVRVATYGQEPTQ
ncbi:sigma-E factor negative regulatory protein [Salinisphaera sp. T31B1]|uniref:sigma-E factor negative regulatory protein n=1 Tax=Salinisphaera sp. T31B1 TaxID=727963 RepID=UPI0033423BF2